MISYSVIVNMRHFESMERFFLMENVLDMFTQSSGIEDIAFPHLG